MNSKLSLFLLILAPVIVLGFQNCSAYQLDPSLAGSSTQSSLNPGSTFDTPYVDGLAAGTAQTGALFARDPSTASSNDRLSFTVDLSPYVVQGTIKHLNGSQSYLTDGFVSFNVDDEISTYASPTGSLIYPQTDGRFQQVNAYYHTDRLIADLSGQSLFPTSTYVPIQVNAHCQDAYQNAYYDYIGHLLCLGYTTVGSTYVWAADDTDVVTHEFGHSLNHTYSTTDILGSTTETGAMDEAFADLWAYRNSGDPRVSRWYGRSLDSPTGTGSYPGLRNLDAVLVYPNAVDKEVHDDSRFISAAVKDVEATGGMDSTTLAKFEKHLLESLQLGHGFSDIIAILQNEASTYGVSASNVTSTLTARGLYRKDPVADIILDTTKPVYVVDNHDVADVDSSTGAVADTNLANGNCNGALDSGETVILFPNIRNTGTIKGSIRTNLVSNTTGVTVLSGGDYGFVYRIPASTTYLAGEMGYTPKSEYTGDYGERFIQNAFYVKVASTFSGTANFTLNVVTMNTMDTTSEAKAITFSLPVGTVANMSACTSSTVDKSVYP